jgi:hypothetical protein
MTLTVEQLVKRALVLGLAVAGFLAAPFPLMFKAFIVLPVAPLIFFAWRRGGFRYERTSLGTRNIVSGFLAAILVTLGLQIITPPNLKLTSKTDPSSLTGKLVWNTHFELAVIAIAFLIGLALGNLGNDGQLNDS